MLKHITLYSIIAAVSVLALFLVCFVLGFKINTTRSIPVGLYRVSNEPITKGAYVIFCPPQHEVFNKAQKRGYIGAGWCPGGFGYMMKQILAAKGDSVSVAADGVKVNDLLLPNSTPHEADNLNRPLPHYRTKRVLNDSEVLLMSNASATSFDARYFGPIHRSQINAVIRPIFTW